MNKKILIVLIVILSGITAVAQEKLMLENDFLLKKDLYLGGDNKPAYLPRFLQFNNIYNSFDFNKPINNIAPPTAEIARAVGNSRLLSQTYFSGFNAMNGQAATYSLGKNFSYTAFSYTSIGITRCFACRSVYGIEPTLNRNSGVQLNFGKPGGAVFSISVSASRNSRY